MFIMRWLNRLAAVLFGALSVGYIRSFFDKYEVLVVDREDITMENGEKIMRIQDLKPDNYDSAMDLRGTPTHECVCGCNIWNVKVIFEESQIATYFLEMQCVECGSLATAPTPLDRESQE